MTGLIVAVAGLAIGSFLTVCIERLPRGRSVLAPGSACPTCGGGIRWFDNIPLLGYLRLRGRCRRCRAPISPIYPIVEAVTPLLFLLQYLELGPEPALVPRLLFTSALVVLCATDLRRRILPNAITLPGIAVGLAAAGWFAPGWPAAPIGAAVGGGVLWAISEAYYQLRGRHDPQLRGGPADGDLARGLGEGDIKMLAMIGAFLGARLALLTLAWASLLGAAVGLVLVRTARVDWRYPLPFGSFLAAAALAASLVGPAFLDWYLAAGARLVDRVFAAP